MSHKHHSINYIELPMTDVDATKQFYSGIFGGAFQDWGPQYVSFSGAGIDGGFDGVTPPVPDQTGTLVVLYSENLESTLDAIVAAGAEITKPIFDFPGGRRFHFVDPNGNGLAVWSESLA